MGSIAARKVLRILENVQNIIAVSSYVRVKHWSIVTQASFSRQRPFMT